jgi:hypothetical protein
VVFHYVESGHEIAISLRIEVGAQKCGYHNAQLLAHGDVQPCNLRTVRLGWVVYGQHPTAITREQEEAYSGGVGDESVEAVMRVWC